MPAPQFHLTFGDLVAHHPGVLPVVRRAVTREPVYTHLGSLFHDLPYYGNMLAEMIRYAAQRPAIDSPWSYRMHCMRPDKFVASFLRAAHTTEGLTRDERLALVAGLMSHCALDLTLHPLVNYVARRDTALNGGHETFHHRITEKYHALFFHLERFGEDVIGLPEFKQKAMLVKQGWGGGPIESAILRFVDASFRGAYGDAPSATQWSTWVRNFSHFARLMSTPVCRRNSLKTRRNADLRRRYYASDEFEFGAFYAHSERRLAELVNLGYEYFEAGDLSSAAEERFCALARIDDLAEPDPTELPLLPALPTAVERRRRLHLPLPALTTLTTLTTPSLQRDRSSTQRAA
ncbi:MAG TPA: hypothetical protein VH877_22870 [Polyangia bacterium]|nr:hypothetical protein [Polyangia bacterium]